MHIINAADDGLEDSSQAWQLNDVEARRVKSVDRAQVEAESPPVQIRYRAQR